MASSAPRSPQDQPFFDDLTLDGGYRHSHYSTGISANTYKVGLQWAPMHDIRFRGSYNRAIRAPNIIELFNPQSVTNTTEVVGRPLRAGHGAASHRHPGPCMNTGVTAAQYGNGGSTNHIVQCPAAQCAVLNGGNTKLTPEKADTYSVGFTLRPRFLDGFTGSLDYFVIKQDNTIANDPAGLLPEPVPDDRRARCSAPTSCAARAASCSAPRSQGGGYISGTAVNVGAGELDGIDLQATYNLPLSRLGAPDGYGDLQFNFIGSELLKVTTTPQPGDPHLRLRRPVRRHLRRR